MGFLIRLPWPPKQCNPNFKRSNHWRRYRKHVASYREQCWKETLAVMGASPSGLPETLPMVVSFYPPDRRARDKDNMIAAFKSGQDGVADALGIDDKRFDPKHEVCDPVKGGAVLVEFRGEIT